jgi:electron transfer flavoprotein beta subunit
MGPPQAEEALRESISLGADDAVLLSDQAFAGADTLATSYTLAKAIEKMGPFDIVLCGRQTADGDTGQVGPELAEWLVVPIVTNVRQIHEISEHSIRVERMTEEGYEVIEMPLPGIITVVKEINTPRLPSLRGMVKAKSAKIPIWTAPDLGLDNGEIGLAGSPTRVIEVFTPPKARRGEVFQGDTECQVERLISKLKEIKII